MNSSLVALLLLSFAVVASAFHREWDLESRLAREKAMVEEMEKLLPIMSRPRRVIAQGDFKCGKKLYMYVHKVCEAACEPQPDAKDIATICCAGGCSEEVVRASCCP